MIIQVFYQISHGNQFLDFVVKRTLRIRAYYFLVNVPYRHTLYYKYLKLSTYLRSHELDLLRFLVIQNVFQLVIWGFFHLTLLGRCVWNSRNEKHSYLDLLYQRFGAILMSMYTFYKIILLKNQAFTPVLLVGKLSNIKSHFLTTLELANFVIKYHTYL